MTNISSWHFSWTKSEIYLTIDWIVFLIDYMHDVTWYVIHYPPRGSATGADLHSARLFISGGPYHKKHSFLIILFSHSAQFCVKATTSNAIVFGEIGHLLPSLSRMISALTFANRLYHMSSDKWQKESLLNLIGYMSKASRRGWPKYLISPTIITWI